MKHIIHDRIEAIAGAIALGEASDEERLEYREHISACPDCLEVFGGEIEIERVASTVLRARDEEVWEPQLGDVVEKRMRKRSRSLRFGTGVLTLAVAASFGVHVLFAAAIPHLTQKSSAPLVINAGVTRIVLESNAPPSKPVVQPAEHVAAPAVQPRLIVTHNVVQIARAPIPASALMVAVSPKAESKPRELVDMTVHPSQAPVQSHRSAIPIWRRKQDTWRTVARTTTTSLTEIAPQTLTHSAESLEIAPGVTREVAPIGGETAINPQPPMIAYDEGAQGTTAYEVLVDERGVPTKCVITKPAGYPVLDDAVCRAAMKARYTPKMVDGRPVPGVYHDAFTFHMSDQTSMNPEGVKPPRGITDETVSPQRPFIKQGPFTTPIITGNGEGGGH